MSEVQRDIQAVPADQRDFDSIIDKAGHLNEGRDLQTIQNRQRRNGWNFRLFGIEVRNNWKDLINWSQIVN